MDKAGLPVARYKKRVEAKSRRHNPTCLRPLTDTKGLQAKILNFVGALVVDTHQFAKFGQGGLRTTHFRLWQDGGESRDGYGWERLVMDSGAVSVRKAFEERVVEGSADRPPLLLSGRENNRLESEGKG